jgi:hypothetical protein
VNRSIKKISERLTLTVKIPIRSIEKNFRKVNTYGEAHACPGA